MHLTIVDSRREYMEPEPWPRAQGTRWSRRPDQFTQREHWSSFYQADPMRRTIGHIKGKKGRAANGTILVRATGLFPFLPGTLFISLVLAVVIGTPRMGRGGGGVNDPGHAFGLPTILRR